MQAAEAKERAAEETAAQRAAEAVGAQRRVAEVEREMQALLAAMERQKRASAAQVISGSPALAWPANRAVRVMHTDSVALSSNVGTSDHAVPPCCGAPPYLLTWQPPLLSHCRARACMPSACQLSSAPRSCCMRRCSVPLGSRKCVLHAP